MPTNLETISHSFFSELQNAYEGKQSSIPFLVHDLPRPPRIQNGSRIQVMVFGGTVFKTSVFQKQSDGCIQISEETEKKTPLFIDKDTFVNFTIQELQEDIQYLAINFAYPITPVLQNNVLDGTLLHGTKEHIFAGLIGKQIGKTIQEVLLEKKRTPIFITVANDAVCLLLSEATKDNWNSIIGGIVGTGTNYAFTLPHKRVVNLESGNFNAFPLSESGKHIDAESANKGEQLIEKEIAGAYLYKHYNYYVQKEGIDTPLLTSTSQLSDVAKNSTEPSSQLAQRILEHSAALAAAQMAGIVEFDRPLVDNRSQPISADFNIIMEGTLFWEGYHYQAYLKKYLQRLGVLDKITFSPARHHGIQGGIKLLTGLS